MKDLIVKIASALAALTLILAACASDDADTTSTDDDTTTSVAAADTDTGSDAEDATAGQSGDSDAATSDTSANDSTTSSTSTTVAADTETSADDATPGGGSADNDLGPLLAVLVSELGPDAEISGEVVDCIEARDVDLQIAPTAPEEEIQAATLAVFACAPDELAATLAADTEIPPGATEDDVACVIAETFRYLADLPPAEAFAALDEPTVPDDVRAGLTPLAVDACDLTADQVNAIFDV